MTELTNTPLSDAEREELGQIIRLLNIQYAVKHEPVHPLRDMMALRSMTELRRLGRLLKVKYYAKKAKPELIEGIAETLLQPENLLTLLRIIGRPSLELLVTAADQGETVRDRFVIQHFLPSRVLGLLQLFHHEDRLVLVVPDEIRDALQGLRESGDIDRLHFEQLVTDYAVAAVNLYGALSLDEFTALFNDMETGAGVSGQTGAADEVRKPASTDGVASILKSVAGDEIGLHFRKGWLVDDSFADGHYADVDELLKARAGKPRYTPNRDEFLRYADWNYYQSTPQIEALWDHLAEYIDDEDTLKELVDEIQYLCAAEARLQEIINAIEEAGITFKGLDEITAAMNLVMDVHNNTRCWSNFGHTPNELARLRPKGRPGQSGRQPASLPASQPASQPSHHGKVIPFPGADRAAAGDKPGRNDPCPCGSGRKYKNCCGKSI